MKKTIKAWAVLVDGKPNIPNGMFDTEWDAKRAGNWAKGLPIVPCTVTYDLPTTNNKK